ncbi:MAG TPA: COX15/CtaA family protein [Gaiella sp.]|jgi:cytochrome c oxidase assembly protein subunit 15|nr:COX15/CtaA family protein [Gaiella sp.]
MSLRARLREPVSPRRFLQLSVAAVAVLGLVVASGAFVRLTGSGLGCDNWPRCGSTPFPAKDFHAIVEFGNRVVALAGILASLATWHASRRVAGLGRRVSLTALAAFLGTVAQIPLGGLTVILELHPLAVMSHFLLALVVVALSVVVAFEAWSHAGGLGAPVAPRWLRLAAIVGVVACGAMVVTGAVATASGPHPGADEDVHRLGLGISDTVYVHVRATAVYGIGLLLVGWQLLRVRRVAPGVVLLASVLLGVLLVQMLVGEIQYRNALPWGLVLVHVTLGAAIWGLTVAVAYALWRPPLALVVPASDRVDAVGEPLRSR